MNMILVFDMVASFKNSELTLVVPEMFLSSIKLREELPRKAFTENGHLCLM